MAIRKLLLPLTGTAAGEAALATALTIARRWNAHVLALHVRVDSRDVAPLAGEGLSGAMIEEMMSATEKESNDRAHAVRSMFERFVARHDVVVQEAHPGFGSRHGQFRGGDGARGGYRGATGAPRRPDRGAASRCRGRRFVVRCLARGAVRFRPAGADFAAGRRRRRSAPACAWHGTGPPSRLRPCWRRCPGCSVPKAVAILSAEGYQRRGPGSPDLAAYLALHGVHAEIVTFRAVGGSVGAGLLAAAADFGCDLLSMGAYSHSRLRQLILGGVTRHVLENARLPVMMKP